MKAAENFKKAAEIFMKAAIYEGRFHSIPFCLLPSLPFLHAYHILNYPPSVANSLHGYW